MVDARRVKTRDEDGDPRGERGTPRRGGDARVERAFRIAYGRRPDNKEKALARRHVEQMTAYHREPPAPGRVG